jgi:hypothetical protein
MPITMERIEREMGSMFAYELKLFVYHKLNGRDAEAQTYLDAYYEEQDRLKKEYDEAEEPPMPKIEIPRFQEVFEECKEDM